MERRSILVDVGCPLTTILVFGGENQLVQVPLDFLGLVWLQRLRLE